MNQGIIYNPLSYQEEFHNSTKPKVYLSGGYGSGKTYSLVMKMFQLMHINRGLPGGMVTPTLKMFKRDVLPTIQEICTENEIYFKFHRETTTLLFPTTQSKVYIFHGEDHGESIKGPNLAFMLFNECTLISKPTFDSALSRVRLKKATLRQVALSGTPEGFDWNYEYFVENPRDDTDFIWGDTRLNKFISDDYVEMLTESYDEKMIEQYVDGKFINIRGDRACYAFDRRKHVKKDITWDPLLPIWVSMDFNVTPMSATLWQRLPLKSKVVLEAFDEICIPGSNTYEMCAALKEKGITPQHDPQIYPDPAGIGRSTKSRGMSDFAILKEHGYNILKYKSKIRVRDCMNSLNNLFAKNRIMISSKCRNLIADLEQCTIKRDVYEIDKSNIKRSHWLDGAKNMADYEFPIRKPRPITQERIR